MALQDLTPQLRTRLSRVERAVGLFVMIATLLLVAGFAYYVYHTAKRKGWFATKIVYETGLNNAAGLQPGDRVKLMGFDVGQLLEVIPNDPNAWYGVTVRFEVQEPNFGYIWTDSKVRVAPADFLGNRYLEVLKGQTGIPTVAEQDKRVVGVINSGHYAKFTNALHDALLQEFLPRVREENPTYNQHALRTELSNEVAVVFSAAIRQAINPSGEPNEVSDAIQRAKDKTPWIYVPRESIAAIWIDPLESPALTERLETIVTTAEMALPNILNLTNQLTEVLTNAAATSSNLSRLVADTRPAITNLNAITENLKNPKGSLGEWILPTNLTVQLEQTLRSADQVLQTADQTLLTTDRTLSNTDTNLTLLVSNLNLSLENLANLTSNLNGQVQANTNVLSEISSAIVNADDLVQGLKRHWLLRSAFRTNKTDRPQQNPEDDTLETPRPSHPGTRR